MYVCISSSLIKPELQSKIRAIDVNQRFLVRESSFNMTRGRGGMKILKLEA